MKLSEQQLQEIRERIERVEFPTETHREACLAFDSKTLLAHIAALEAERGGFTHQVAELTANLKRCTIASRESERQVTALEQALRLISSMAHQSIPSAIGFSASDFERIEELAKAELARPEVSALLPKPNTNESAKAR